MEKIKIISGHTSNYSDMYRLNRASIDKYVAKHRFAVEYYNLDGADKPHSWVKLDKILDSFAEGFEVVLWVDCDAVIHNIEYDFRSLLKDDKDIYIAKDFNNFNLGVILIKNTDFSKRVLNKMSSMEEFRDHVWWEQAAFIDLYDKDWEGIQGSVEIVPQDILNAYHMPLFGKDIQHVGQVNESSFIVHFPSLPFHQRLAGMQEFTCAK